VSHFGSERRPYWSKEQKRAIVAEAFARGASVSAVARRTDIGRRTNLSMAPAALQRCSRLRRVSRSREERLGTKTDLTLVRVAPFSWVDEAGAHVKP